METFRLYLRLISVQIRSQFQYRVSMLFEIFGIALTAFAFFFAFALILEKFNNIAGWTLAEVAFLWGLVEISFGVEEILFSGFDDSTFSQLIRLGQFDQILLRPVGVTLQIMGSTFLARRLERILEGGAIFIFALTRLSIYWTPMKILLLPIASASMVAFFAGLMIFGATLTFWTVQPVEAVNIFTYGGTEMMSYPMSIYPDWIRRFFTFVLPAIFLNYTPALYILGKPDPLHLPAWTPFLAPLAGLSVFAAALVFWHFGVNHYQGTGS